MKIFRIITIFADISILVWFLFMALSEGLGEPSTEWLLFIGFVLFVCFNLYFTISSTKEDDWISLWMKRKNLEEKRKISELENIS
jgi:membrane-bound acyltransferase YfiQ involved in biofilm formation